MQLPKHIVSCWLFKIPYQVCRCRSCASPVPYLPQIGRCNGYSRGLRWFKPLVPALYILFWNIRILNLCGLCWKAILVDCNFVYNIRWVVCLGASWISTEISFSVAALISPFYISSLLLVIIVGMFWFYCHWSITDRVSLMLFKLSLITYLAFVHLW